MDATEILVVILASALALFLVLSIVLVVILIKIMRQIQAITTSARSAVDNIGKVVATASKAAAPMVTAKFVTNLVRNLVKNRK